MCKGSTETKSNGQETLETLTTAKKEILDNLYKIKAELIATQNLILKIATKKILDDLYKIKADLSAIQNLNLEMTKELFGIPKTKITLIAGPMCAGKSAALIKKSKELHNSGLSYQCYRAKLSERTIGDSKDSAKEIKSREFKESIQAIPLKPDFDVEALINSIKNEGYEVIIFDEIHFLPKQKFEELIEGLKKIGLQEIIFASLDTDFLGRKFAQFELLSKIADETILLTADCSIEGCNERATHSVKISGNANQQIEAGGEGMYQPCCYLHWKHTNRLLDNNITIDKKLEDKYSEKIKNLIDANNSFNENSIIEFKNGTKICFNTKDHTYQSIQ